MPPVPDAAAWDTFTQLGIVLIFLATLVAAVWRIVAVRRGRARPRPDEPEPTAPDDARPSPEAAALIEATHSLVNAVTVMAERTEAMGRVHRRLDEVNDRITASTTEAAEMKGQLVQINGTLKLIHEYLLNQK